MAQQHDTAAIVTHFSGLPEDASRSQKIEALAARLDLAGQPVSIKGIEKWFERGDIPASRLLQIFDLPLIKGRKPCSLDSFRLPAKKGHR
jgi:hypothetical protein